MNPKTEYWIELHQSKKRIVLLFLLNLRMRSHGEFRDCCPEGFWIREEKIDGDKIPDFIIVMDEGKLKKEISLNGGAIKWV